MAAAQAKPTGIPDWGVDLPSNRRPGVPKEVTPPKPLPGSHWTTPERQEETVEVLKRADLEELTPVFSTALPPRGLSGQLRRVAYKIPDHDARHWMMLRVADKVDVIENNFGVFLLRALPAIGIATAAGVIIARRLRPRRRFGIF